MRHERDNIEKIARRTQVAIVFMHSMLKSDFGQKWPTGMRVLLLKSAKKLDGRAHIDFGVAACESDKTKRMG